jgi:hypothetical protein
MQLRPKRATITRDSVFRMSTSSTPIKQGVSEETAAPTHQTAIWLADDEVDWLDNCCREIRHGGWRGVTRSALLRSLVQAAKTKALDVAGISGEAELTEALKRSLQS